MTPFAPRCMATMIGSFPHTDPDAAISLVFEHLTEAPIFPQLPKRSFLEGMIAAHVKDLPALVVDEPNQKLTLDTACDSAEALTAFYARALAAEETGDLAAFALPPERASALEPTAKLLERSKKRYPVAKVHLVGPITFQLQVRDPEGRPIFYHDTFQDVLLRQIALQARWLVRRFQPCAERVIAFLDEPALCGFGSSYLLGVSREAVIERLGTALKAAKLEGAIAGVHVCGNTDWPMVIEAGAGLINYDAYGYGPSLLLYPKEIKRFLTQGGILAFGIVPTSEKIEQETPASLEKKFFTLIGDLAAMGVDRELLLEQAMLTPSCGMGSLSLSAAEKVVVTLSTLARSVQAKVRKTAR